MISFRNLIRQQRRNILLGTAIAFGAMVLIMANAFSHGISKTLFERIVRYTNGHVSVSYMRNGNLMNQVFPDGERILAAVKKAAPDADKADESIGVFGRAIGNGVADNIIMVGVDISGKLTPKELKEFQSNFKMIDGSFLALNDKSKGMPVILSEQKAKYLKVKMGDVVRARFTGVTNQAASAQLVVAGIFKPANIFMSSPVFLEMHDLKKLSGYAPHDIAAVHIMLKDPQHQAKLVANRLHDLLKPGLAVIDGTLLYKNIKTNAVMLGIKTDSASRTVTSKKIHLAFGDSAKSFGAGGVILSHTLAVSAHAVAGDTIRILWKGKFDTAGGMCKVIVTGIADSTSPLPHNSLLVNERDFYHAYYLPLPAVPKPEIMRLMPDLSHALWPALAPEYMLMKRCATTQESSQNQREMGRAKFKGIMMDVQSMYETASAILNLEFALNLITFAAGMILFFIILIGVINTLRMTIRERTKEIGTVRAIGMQKGDVRSMFIVETALLALFASVSGTALAFLAMWGLSFVIINAGDNPMGMLLVDGHLFFAPTIIATISYVAFIVFIAVATAFFPARKAANMQASDALRHYE